MLSDRFFVTKKRYECSDAELYQNTGYIFLPKHKIENNKVFFEEPRDKDKPFLIWICDAEEGISDQSKLKLSVFLCCFRLDAERELSINNSSILPDNCSADEFNSELHKINKTYTLLEENYFNVLWPIIKDSIKEAASKSGFCSNISGFFKSRIQQSVLNNRDLFKAHVIRILYEQDNKGSYDFVLKNDEITQVEPNEVNQIFYYQDSIQIENSYDNFNHVFCLPIIISESKNECISSTLYPEIDFKLPYGLLSLDNIRANLPELPTSFLSNSSDGLVDIFWPEDIKADDKYYEEIKLDKKYIAKDPWELVKEETEVAIDFGTSSTVVATKNESDEVELIRISYSSSQTLYNQYENPTVLRFCDFGSFFKAWKEVPYKPFTKFTDLKCSHEAKNELGQSSLRNSLRSIKTWCCQAQNNSELNFTDEHSLNFQIIPPKYDAEDSNIGDFQNRALDPIEVYAYYLGLNLNTQNLRAGSIFLNYSMTFPVNFDSRTKQIILQGFRRGLLRSLPPSLIYSTKWNSSCLNIKEVASEPVALAASFLKELNIEPTKEGVPFAVFDFGGGTTDFAVGLYKTPSSEEEETTDWEQVLHIVEIAGDKNLGGEHLVDLITYSIIKENINEILNNNYKIKYTLPYGMKPFPGSEILWGNSSIAYQNTEILKETLRDIWEKGCIYNTGSGQAELTDVTTVMVNVWSDEVQSTNISMSLKVDQNMLRNIIIDKIEDGLDKFFITIRNSPTIEDKSLDNIHVIFSGNSCRSPLAIIAILNKIHSIENASEEDAIKIIPHFEMLGSALKQFEKKSDDSTDDFLKKFWNTPCPWKEEIFDTQNAAESYESELEKEHDDNNENSTSIRNGGLYSNLFNNQYGKAADFFKINVSDTSSLLKDESHLKDESQDFQNSSESEEKEQEKRNYLTYKSFFERILNRSSDYIQKNSLITLKTGVALGLLMLLDGESTGYHENIRDLSNPSESPFNFYVGKIKRDVLVPTLTPKYKYNQWYKLDTVKNNGVTYIAWTDNPLVEKGQHTDYKKKKISVSPEYVGKLIVINPIAPKTVIVAIKDTIEDEQNLFETTIELAD